MQPESMLETAQSLPAASPKQGRLILYCSGGLGNQMFEYAAGRFFARRLERALEVVKPPVDKQRWGEYERPFQLEAFRIREKPRETRLLDRIFFQTILA